MPFRIQCLHCQKYMIIEDEYRGRRIKCLVCKQAISADAAPAAAAPSTDPQIRTCPLCGARMRVSATAAQVRCPKCKCVF